MKWQLTFLALGLVFAASACAPMVVGSSARAGLGTRWGETRESRVQPPRLIFRRFPSQVNFRAYALKHLAQIVS
jgi:hypothetical protein